MSALPPKADIVGCARDVRKVPKADISGDSCVLIEANVMSASRY
jgi:hypothetical protein